MGKNDLERNRAELEVEDLCEFCRQGSRQRLKTHARGGVGLGGRERPLDLKSNLEPGDLYAREKRGSLRKLRNASRRRAVEVCVDAGDKHSRRFRYLLLCVSPLRVDFSRSARLHLGPCASFRNTCL